MPEFFFQRYVNGQRMADDVLITKQATLEDAIPAALRLCWNSPKSVLVHIPQTPWRDIESAPKDGTSIEVWDESPGAVNPAVVFWENGVWVYADNLLADAAPDGALPSHWRQRSEPPR